jgi:apoptosis-inducing factor 3
VAINYVGHAEAWDSTDVVGSIQERDGLVRFRKNGRTLAVASISRDRESLFAELELETSRQRAASRTS